MGGRWWRLTALWLMAVVFPAPLVVVLNAQLTDAPRMRFYISLGLIAYCWWLLAMLLSIRPRWLDRFVGLPPIYLLHGVLGVLVVVVAYLHRHNTFATGDLPRNLGDWAFWMALGLMCYSALFLSGWLTDRVPALSTLKQRVEPVLSHQVSMWVHRLNLALVALIWLHVHVIDRIAHHLGFMILFDAYTLGVLAAWAWRKWVAPDTYPTGSVTQNRALNERTRRLVVTLNAPAREATPGDFYFLRFEAPGLSREWHPFSATDASRDALALTIRRIGDFTRRVDAIAVGTTVRVDGPYGRFDRDVAALPHSAPLVLVGMGAGIAPMLSLLDGHLGERRTHVMWSIHRPDDDYYAHELHEAERRSQGTVHLTTRVGRFGAEQLRGSLAREEIDDGVFFVVGPSRAVLSTRRTLRRLGVAGNRIHDERLTM